LALFRGSYAHEILEHNFDYSISKKLNHVFTQEEADKVVDMIKEFRKTKLGNSVDKLINHPDSVLEEDFAFNPKLKIVDFKDKSAWFRGSADLYNIKLPQPLIVDYKTGKDKSGDEDFGEEQGMVYAIYLFIKYPNLFSIKAIFIFIEHSTKKEIYYTRDKLAIYMRLLYDKTIYIERTNNFKADVTALCDYCDFNDTEFCSAQKELKEKSTKFMGESISLDF